MGDTRIRTTHVGSLIRPDDVIAIMRRLDKGEQVDEAEHKAVLEKAYGRSCAGRRRPGSTSSPMGSSASRRGTTTCTAPDGLELRPYQGDTSARCR